MINKKQDDAIIELGKNMAQIVKEEYAKKIDELEAEIRRLKKRLVAFECAIIREFEAKAAKGA